MSSKRKTASRDHVVAFDGVLLGRPRFGRAIFEDRRWKAEKRTPDSFWILKCDTRYRCMVCQDASVLYLYLMILRSCLRLIRTLLVKLMEINGCDLDSLDHPLMMNLWHKIWCCPCLPNKDNQTWSALARPPVKFRRFRSPQVSSWKLPPSMNRNNAQDLAIGLGMATPVKLTRHWATMLALH